MGEILGYDPEAESKTSPRDKKVEFTLDDVYTQWKDPERRITFIREMIRQDNEHERKYIEILYERLKPPIDERKVELEDVRGDDEGSSVWQDMHRHGEWVDQMSNVYLKNPDNTTVQVDGGRIELTTTKKNWTLRYIPDEGEPQIISYPDGEIKGSESIFEMDRNRRILESIHPGYHSSAKWGLASLRMAELMMDLTEHLNLDQVRGFKEAHDVVSRMDEF